MNYSIGDLFDSLKKFPDFLFVRIMMMSGWLLISKNNLY